ncbi:hypothetical protein WJ17_18710 [Burkholderia vietnamiensis]|nr:hypothetical protein WJ17_18710 [Burkholderia vietnamiensis]
MESDDADDADDAPSSNDAVRLACIDASGIGKRRSNALQRRIRTYSSLRLSSLLSRFSLRIDAAGIHDAQFHRDLICVCGFGPTCRAGV